MLCLFNKISNCQEAFDNSASATLCSWVFLSIVVNRCAALLGIGLSSAQVMTQKWTLGSLKMHKQFFTWSIQTKANSKPVHVDATKRGEQCKGRAIDRVNNKRSNNNSASSSNQGKAEQGRRFENEDDPHPHPADALITTYFHRASEQRDARQNATRQVEGEHTEQEKSTNHRTSSTISNNYDKLRSHKQKHVV